MFASKDTLLTRPSGGYTIARSVRLRSSATAYLNRTPAGSPTSAQKYTQSFWMKRGTLGVYSYLYNCEPSDYSRVYFYTDDLLYFDFRISGSATSLGSVQVFRDPSAWYHLVIAVDTTQATSSNRVKVYVNGAQITLSGTYPAQNGNTVTNSANAQRIGSYITGTQPFDGYMTEINFIDGQQLTPSSFGETDSITGVWKPKAYSGSYGTNGFELNFSDNSNNTAATIGKDYSGNGNNWTPNNISVTSGSTYDSMTDVPTLTSATAANYCVVDVLSPIGSASALSTVASANLQLTHSGSTYSQRFGNMVVSSGKWYFEFTLTNIGYPSLSVGVSKLSTYPTYNGAGGQATSCAAVGYFTGTSLSVCTEAGGTGAGSISSQTWSNGDIIMVAFSIDTGKIWWGKNGTWYSSGNPAADTNNITTITSGAQYRPWVVLYGTTTDTSLNFGQRPFSYTPPTGFVALNTYNLPASTITNGAAYMAATLYTGNGGTQSITNTVGSTSFQPDFVWIKSRSAAYYNTLYDSVRGSGATKSIYSNTTDAEGTFSTLTNLSSFNSNGFTVGTTSSSPNTLNESGVTFVGWQWKGGGTAVSNTSGSITSSVSANTTAGFSVVTYTGNGTNGATIGHGLGVALQMLIVKKRSASNSWRVWHTSIPNTNYLELDTTVASQSGTDQWNSTSPSSTVFTVGTSGSTNSSGATFVAYCFAAVAGYSAFGSYTGNGSADGPFIYTGFRPRFVLYKITSAINDWEITDSSRNGYNGYSGILFPDLSNAEGSYTSNGILLLSNGFKFNGPTGSGANGSGQTYIYMAFAEVPFKTSLAR
jgi:hypothetical protein